MKISILFVFAGILPVMLAAQPTTPSPTPADFKGQAYDLKSGKPAYVEEYRERFFQQKLTASETRYLDMQGHLIVHRNLDFFRFACKPDYKLEDFRDGYEEGANLTGDQVHVFVRTDRNSPRKEKTLRVPEPCVIDGGFNNFLKQNWETLTSGKTVSFNFVAPSQLDYFAFRAREDVKSETSGKHEKVFFIEVDNALLRLLVKPIRVTYDSETRRMTRYQGISNINGADGKSLKVNLVYPEKGP